jgi:uncharacterized protein YraI
LISLFEKQTPPRRTSMLHLARLTLCLVGILLLTGCGLGGGSADPAAPVTIRTPKPTFTPTLPAAQNPPAEVTPAAPAANAAAAAPNPSSSADTPKAVVNSPLVNARAGPSTDFDIVATVERGAEYEIIGADAGGEWWHVCCVDGSEAWLNAEFVDTDGPVDSVVVAGSPVANGGGTVAAEPAPTAAPAAPAAPAVEFTLEAQEQFPETEGVRIFLYAYTGNSALEGYALRVTKDGIELPTTGTSFGGQPAFTWPFQDPRQRYQNYKVEFPDTQAAGTWQVQIIDSAGNVVGPPASFTLTADDLRQELYVRYIRR